MEANLKSGGLLPSAMALKNSLSQKPDTSSEQTMLTSYQRELLLRGEKEIDGHLEEGRLKEKLIFDAFYQTRPDFAGRPVRWRPGEKPNYILCGDNDGKIIGVELAEWLNEKQMKEFKRREKVENSFLRVIQSEQIAAPANIGLVTLMRESESQSLTPLQTADAQGFRRELLALIRDLDPTCGLIQDTEYPQGYWHGDFSNYPTLRRYLGHIHVLQRSKIPTSLGGRWIVFPNRGGAYDPQDAIDALLSVLDRKTSEHSGLHQEQAVDELHLLIYYDQGWFYNTPFTAPGMGFREIAQIAAQQTVKTHGVFSKIFLFNSLYGDQEVEQLWPRR